MCRVKWDLLLHSIWTGKLFLLSLHWVLPTERLHMAVKNLTSMGKGIQNARKSAIWREGGNQDNLFLIIPRFPNHAPMQEWNYLVHSQATLRGGLLWHMHMPGGASGQMHTLGGPLGQGAPLFVGPSSVGSTSLIYRWGITMVSLLSEWLLWVLRWDWRPWQPCLWVLHYGYHKK